MRHTPVGWQSKVFKTQAAMDAWIVKNKHRVQFEVIYVNNAYGVTYRRLNKIG
jgi:hypothetical protein